MSRTTSGTPGLTRRRVLVGTAILSTSALVAGGIAAQAVAAPTPVLAHVYDVATDTAASGPAAGGSSVVRLTGTDLDKVTSVWFGGVKSAHYIVDSSTLIYATPPAVEDRDLTATYNVDVTLNSAGSSRTATQDDNYTYTNGPTVDGVATSSDGKNVVVTGSALTGASAVLFGDTLVKVDKKTPAASATVSVKAPSLKGGQYDVSVITPLGIGTKPAAWGAAPVLTKLFLASEYATKSTKAATVARATSDTGSVTTAFTKTATATDTATGTVVIATGSGFSGLQSIKFGKASAKFVVVSDTVARVIVPPMASDDVFDSKTGVTASVYVVATNGNGSSKATGTKFQYDGLPTVTAITDVVGAATGTANILTITGTRLDKAKVKIGTAAAKVDSSSSSTSLKLTVGKGTADAEGDIVITTAAGTITAPVKYTWKAADVTKAWPTVS